MSNTIIRVPSQNQEYRIPGQNLTIQQIQAAYASEISGLQSMNGTESTEGADRVVTFTPRTGNKG